jgi:hypothetical protein
MARGAPAAPPGWPGPQSCRLGYPEASRNHGKLIRREEAEVILYDQLAGAVRKLLPKGAELIDCGKSGSRHTLEQEEIERAKGSITSIEERLSVFSKELSGLRAARDGITGKIRAAEKKRADREAAVEKVTLQITALVEKETSLVAAVEALKVQAAPADGAFYAS